MVSFLVIPPSEFVIRVTLAYKKMSMLSYLSFCLGWLIGFCQDLDLLIKFFLGI